MIELKNKQGELIPPRPQRTKELANTTITGMLNNGGLYSINKDHEDADIFISDFMSIFDYNKDPYELARDMDDRGAWDVDMEFVEDMSTIKFRINACHTKAERDWYATHKPVPTYEPGTEICLASETDDYHGYIDGVSETPSLPGYYLVKTPEQLDETNEDKSRILIKFEDVKLRPLTVGDIVTPISRTYTLASGAERYPYAVVISLTPLKLCSEHSDMLWKTNIKRENYKKVGRADDDVLKKCLTRLN